MNMMDAWVKRVHGIPLEKYGKWWLSVTYECEGREGRQDLMFDTFDEANTTREGFKFLT